MASPQGIELGAVLLNVLGWFWYRRGYLNEGRLWAKRALASPVLQKDSMAQAMTLAFSGIMAIWQGEQETGLTQLQSSLAILQRLEDEQWMPHLLMGTAFAFINRGQDSAAQPLLKEALSLFKQQNLPSFPTVTAALVSSLMVYSLASLILTRNSHLSFLPSLVSQVLTGYILRPTRLASDLLESVPGSVGKIPQDKVDGFWAFFCSFSQAYHCPLYRVNSNFHSN